METYQFTLIVEGPDLQSDDLIAALYEAGCDDGLVGRTDGIQYLDFEREAPRLDQAFLSAIADIERVPGVEVVRIADAGLVSMADIGNRTDRTRESIRLLVAGERGPGGFPPPVTDPRSRYRLWRWSEVEHWFAAAQGEDLASRDDHVEATINAGLELRKHRRRVAEAEELDLHDLVGF